jgi:hypothetical protein
MNGNRVGALAIAGLVVLLAGCGGRGSGTNAVPTVPAEMSQTPQSVSPASIHPPTMKMTPVLPPSAMTSLRRPQSSIAPPGWTQTTGGASFIAANPTDGSFWVLSSQGPGPDYTIWHNSGGLNGTWTNIPGAASRMAVAPNGTLWVINSAGGIYAWNGSSWSTIAGGASDITVGSDNTVYVISNQPGGPYGRGIYHYANGTWTQLAGAAVRIAASLDTGTYPNGVVPGGVWVTNALESIYYFEPNIGFYQIPGAAIALAPTTSGGLFALGYLGSPSTGYPIYYDDLSTGTWTNEPGAATSIATDGKTVYVVGVGGGIYLAPIQTQLVGGGTPLTGPRLATNNGWGAPAVAEDLNFPVQSRYDGSGFKIAIVIDSWVSPMDISTYLGYFQIPVTSRTITYRLIDGAKSTPTVSGQFEATLDLETVAGLAPGANIELYVVPSLNSIDIVDAYNAILSDNNASIVSSSFGGCEYSGQNAEGVVLQTGANQAIAFVASSGDQGNECYSGPSTYIPGVSYPASDPNVIGVGGTETWSAPLTTTVVWNDTHATGGLQSASGGGISAYVAIPSFQNGVAGIASTQYRNVPDVSMPAAAAAIYLGGWGGAEGTSWSAPQFAAMLAEVYEYCSSAFYSPSLLPYYVASHGSGAFIDVTSGNNQYGVITPYYS